MVSSHCKPGITNVPRVTWIQHLPFPLLNHEFSFVYRNSIAKLVVAVVADGFHRPRKRSKCHCRDRNLVHRRSCQDCVLSFGVPWYWRGVGCGGRGIRIGPFEPRFRFVPSACDIGESFPGTSDSLALLSPSSPMPLIGQPCTEWSPSAAACMYRRPQSWPESRKRQIVVSAAVSMRRFVFEGNVLLPPPTADVPRRVLLGERRPGIGVDLLFGSVGDAEERAVLGRFVRLVVSLRHVFVRCGGLLYFHPCVWLYRMLVFLRGASVGSPKLARKAEVSLQRHEEENYRFVAVGCHVTATVQRNQSR